MNDVILREPGTPRRGAPKSEKPARRETKKSGIGAKIALSFFSLLVFLVVAVILLCNVLLNGPSKTARNLLVLSAKQASATKWIPALFLDEKLVEEIEAAANEVTHDFVSIDEIQPKNGEKEQTDEWADAIDGIRFLRISKPNFKAYLLMIRDPSRVFVGTGSDYKAGKSGGMRIFEIAEKYQATAVINGGEFSDPGGMGTGDLPMGITFSKGELVWNDGLTNRTFLGFTNDNRLVVSEGMTKQQAQDLGIRDGVCFQRGNSLITNDGSTVTMHYEEGNTGAAQRTVIGQRADGVVLMLVTDGRTASSIGATHNDLIDIMLEYGAVAAGKLDGGSSSLMYYRDYFDLYHLDVSTLDEYQKQGLVNKYKAFTKPRRIPTYFVVGGAS